ncbi:small ribosomal subunit protein bS18m-like [Rhynchophorus ferrugineus]|uniref:small ribosomal subunit protein bS18m-like n=1 Tax=Rhynchophorus ferrugineus TaxID=354439 RepID=UPI003FCEAA02
MNFLTLRKIYPAFGRIILRSNSSAVNNNVSNDEPDFDMENPFEKEQQKCILCKHNIVVDYKNVKLLSQFQSPYTGRIYGSHITGLCKTQQKLVEAEIIKAQSAGLMATYLKEPCFLDDPVLFNVDKPIRPHKY